jgi:hypothetical protein
MTHFKFNRSLTLSVFVLALAAWCGNERSLATVQTQEAEKVLEIERYPDEPLQLVDIRIGAQSVKDRLQSKFRDKATKWGLDTVKFHENDDWFRRVSISVRNASDKPIYGVQAFLFFKPTRFPMNFSLQLTSSRELYREPLQPGAEIELSVSEDLLNRTLTDLKDRGAQLEGSLVSFSLDTVMFTRELQWYRGKLVRPDSTTPGKWVPVDQR